MYFYNKVTDQIVDYQGLKSQYAISWPTISSSTGVDDRIADTNPPNIFLPSNPTLANWERLTIDPEPTGLKIWEIAISQPVSQESDGYWYRRWSVETRDAGQMVEANILVADRAKQLRDSMLIGEIEHNGIYANATEETRGAISDLIEYLMSDGADLSINWKGSNDAYGLARWGDANVEDLQELMVMVTAHQQKAFTAERQTIFQHLNIAYFDYLSDVDAFYGNAYDLL